MGLDEVFAANSRMGEHIAIVGMSCRYPGANNPEEFWNLLISGNDVMGPAPCTRWNNSDYPYQIPESCKSMNAGFLNIPVDEFDAQFFEISPKEATSMDPQSRLLLELVWEGLEDAGVDPLTLRGSDGGVFVGSWLNDFKDLLLQCPGYEDFYRRYMGNSSGSMAARLSFALGVQGPSITTESGCSSSMVAVHLACKSLQRKECNLALACGVNLLLKPFDKEEIPVVMSPEGKCLTFDIGANGYGRAEGIGVLLLKRLSEAVENGDRIWGVLRGSAMVQEGLSKSLGTPTVNSEARCMELAMWDAGVKPEEVTYVEAHGTGTQVGDPMEMKAIQKAYHSKGRKTPLMIGSVKTVIGHTESCSGIAGIMKVILAMAHKTIPPHVNLRTLNPAIDLDAIPAIIPTEATKWERNPGDPHIAGVSSFGITGTDAHVIIEGPPASSPGMASKSETFLDRPLHLIKFSAKTRDALDVMMDRFKDHCALSEDALANIAFMANTGRATFANKAVILASNKEQVVRSLETGEATYNEQEPVLATPPKSCFLFTGQGNSYTGTGRTLYETCPVFRQQLDHCSDLLQNNYDIDLKTVLWGVAPQNLKRVAMYNQIALFCTEYSLAKLWESWGVTPDYVLGHSMGEFAAAVCADLLTLPEALTLLCFTPEVTDNLPEGKMLVVRANQQILSDAMAETGITLDFAAFNSEVQTVLSGDTSTVLQFSQYLTNVCKLKCTLLEGGVAFHSRLMDPFLVDYRKAAEAIYLKRSPESRKQTCGFISGARGCLQDTSALNAEYWVTLVRESVLFMEASNTALAQEECQIFLEIGPQPVLSAMMLANGDQDKRKTQFLPSLKRGSEAWSVMLRSQGKLYLSGIAVDWRGFDRGYTRQKVSIPHYPFLGKRYWPEVQTDRKMTLVPADRNMHPLLGKELEVANNFRTFENTLNIDGDSRLAFLADHRIGSMVIFPGAAYLEMCVAAVSDIEDITCGAVIVENLVIAAPLVLTGKMGGEETKDPSVTLQTCVDSVENVGRDARNLYQLKVFSRAPVQRERDLERAKWLPHATATISFLESSPNFPEENLGFLQENGRSHSKIPFYERLSLAGLHFGASFQSIKNYWWSFDKDKYLLAQLSTKIRDNEGFSLTHPVTLDAMLQAIILFENYMTIKSDKRPRLLVPVKIGRFVWGPKTSFTEDVGDMYIKVIADVHHGVTSPIAHLLTSSGVLVATMSAVEFVETTPQAIEAVVEGQRGKAPEMPDMWEQYWKPEEGSPLQYRVNLEETPTFPTLDDRMSPPKTNFGKERRTTWLVFEDTNICCHLKENLEGMGSHVISVKPFPSQEQRLHRDVADGMKMTPKAEADMIRVLTEIGNREDVGTLEGVLYGRALNSGITCPEDCLGPFFHLTKNMSYLTRNRKTEVPLRLLVLTSGQAFIQDTVNPNCHPSTLWGYSRSLIHEWNGRASCRCVDIGISERDDPVSQILYEMFHRGERWEMQVAYMGAVRHTLKTRRITEKPVQETDLKLPRKTRRVQLALPSSRLLGDLAFEAGASTTIGVDQIEVEVKFYALNLRDVLSVIKPTEQFLNVNSVGLDLCGEVVQIGRKATKWKVGDLVCGLNMNGAGPPLSSHLVLHQDLVIPVPSQLTLAEAVTLPAVFATAYRCLFEVARLSSSDKVLIHTASGGVGLVAIQLVKNVVPVENIFVTAGSPRKRAYLRNLGLQHVYNSRDTTYSENILKDTNGEGVTVVLNSLTSPGFNEATLASCSKQARFVEMSKLAIWTVEEVKYLRPDVKYTVVDISGSTEKELADAMSKLRENLENGVIKPLSYIRFDAVKLRQAMQYLQKSKQIGKVVVAMPPSKKNVDGQKSDYATLFNDRSTYLITGGLGGIGFEVCKWMVKQGAKHVLLLGRKPPTPDAAAEIKILNKTFDANVTTARGNVGCFEELKTLLNNLPAMGLPPMRGVMHAAGVLADGLVENQEWSKFSSVFPPKIDGTQNLQELTQSCDLEHFVLFSSFTTLLAPPGQSNYAAANQFQDNWAYYRHSLGLPATSINWGQWCEVGLATKSDIPGIRLITNKQGLMTLEHILRTNKLHVGVTSVKDYAVLRKKFPIFHHMLDPTTLEELQKTGPRKRNSLPQRENLPPILSSPAFWELYQEVATPQDKLALSKQLVCSVLGQVLKLSSSDPHLDESTPFESRGVDSLMFMEIRNTLQDALGNRMVITETLLRHNNTTALLSKLLAARLAEMDGNVTPV